MNLPHSYVAKAQSVGEMLVSLESEGLPTLHTSPPPQFGGPEGHWSPETLLVGAVADCYILTFRALAKAAGLKWINLSCKVDGTLDRDGRNICFTRMDVTAELSLEDGADREVAEKLLHRAEDKCLVSNSLKAERSLQTTIL